MTGNRYAGNLPSIPEHEVLLLWIMAPAGLDGLFRKTYNPPGVPPKQLTRKQGHEIGRKAFTQACF